MHFLNQKFESRENIVKKANNQLENEFDLDDNKQSEMNEVIFFNRCNNIEEFKLKNFFRIKTFFVGLDF